MWIVDKYEKVLPLETPAPPREVPAEFSSLSGFEAPSTKTSNTTHPHHCPKYEVKAIEYFFGEDPFKLM